MKKRREYTNPFIFLFLVLPYGISSGFATVTIPYILVHQGFTVVAAASITALGLSSNIWRFLWAPLADLSLTLHKWYMIGSGFCIATLLIIGFIPLSTGEQGFLTFIVFLSQIAATFVVLPVGGFMAKTVPDEKKGRAGGWYQAGNLGGAIGGGAGIWLYVHYSIHITVIIIAVCMLLCSLAVFRVQPVINETIHSVKEQLKILGKDIKSLFHSHIALFTMAVLILPIGTGAASNVWSAIASDWKVTADVLALVNGALSGAVSIVGCIVGGWIADKVGRWWAYFGAGTLMAIVTCWMFFVPLATGNFIVGVLFYAFALGMLNAAFSTVVLLAIGKGAAATKYAFLSSLGNLPVVYVTMIDGWTHDHWGVKAMLIIESILGVVFILISLAVLWKTKLYKQKLPVETKLMGQELSST